MQAINQIRLRGNVANVYQFNDELSKLTLCMQETNIGDNGFVIIENTWAYVGYNPKNVDFEIKKGSNIYVEGKLKSVPIQNTYRLEVVANKITE